MQDPVSGFEICFNDWNIINSHFPVSDSDRKSVTGQAFEHLSIPESICFQATSYHVQAQNICEGAGRVGEKGVNGAIRECGEGGIVRGKDGESRPSLDRVKGWSQFRGSQRGDKS